MSAEFDAAVADLLGGVYSLFGQAATYSPPGGSPLACLIVIDAADDVAALGESGFVAGRRRIEVRKAEIAAPARGGRFVAGAGTYRIAAQPHVEDPDGLVWSCLCDPL